MAPEIVFQELASLQPSSLVLDPMTGSGTVTRAATEIGHRAIGFDLDPLAVLMARVWLTPLDTTHLLRLATLVVEKAKQKHHAHLPWIDNCKETSEFIAFWFEPKQRDELRRLSAVLSELSGSYADALKVSLSRIIVTKEKGASVARDTSHSRPHRVFFQNDYKVFDGFLKSVAQLCVRLEPEKISSTGIVNLGDARDLDHLEDALVDAVITSPPYLNAIDYLRGHRLSLVWLGLTIIELRQIRGSSVGSEAGVSGQSRGQDIDSLLENAGLLENLPSREFSMVKRYATDLHTAMKEFKRVTKVGGKLLLVVGDSCLRNVSISNAEICIAAAQRNGYELKNRVERLLPSRSRYLPPPIAYGRESLNLRMKSETVLSFQA